MSEKAFWQGIKKLVYHRDAELFRLEASDEIRRLVEMAETGVFHKDSASEAKACSRVKELIEEEFANVHAQEHEARIERGKKLAEVRTFRSSVFHEGFTEIRSFE